MQPCQYCSLPVSGARVAFALQAISKDLRERSEISKSFFTGKGAGLTDFAVIPHFNNPGFQDACGLNAEKWAAKIPSAVYAIDEQTAIKVVAGQVEVVSEGQWRYFSKPA